jgi:CPA2 family monovalent cation:H+ antiporter-2
VHADYQILIQLSVVLAVALVLGLGTQRLGLSPIVGYLLTGIALGPQTPGFEADPKLAADFAEIGVVLLMFGVGLHFHWHELLAVRRIAVPGAVGQIAVATALGAVAAVAFGWRVSEGFIIGMAISVASTVVLVRMLDDSGVLHTSAGHVAVGWLIVEDIFTVLVLVSLPGLAELVGAEEGGSGGVAWSLGLAAVKISILVVLIFTVGRKAIPWLLALVGRTRSRELFTLAVLAVALSIATGSAVVFDVSMALGAFLAGMVVGQTEVSHQAATDALPMRDAFAVLFFVSVGMLFDPRVLMTDLGLFVGMLCVILVAKPLTAFLITWGLRYSIRTSLTVAIALAQIGEFSFLLGNEAMHHQLLAAEGQSLLVTCALVSITINPLMFRALDPLETWLRKNDRVWRFISRRSEVGGAAVNLAMRQRLPAVGEEEEAKARAVIVGYGPVGQTATRILKDFNMQPVIVDLNVDTVREIAGAGGLAIYGDATRRDILDAAGIHDATYLLVTIPDVMTRTVVIMTAKNLNAELRVFARARYIQERAWLEEVGATQIVTEEAETALGLAVLLLREVGADETRIRDEIQRIQSELSLPQPPYRRHNIR